MGPIQQLAMALGAEERTLRRAASQGTLRARRVGPRRLQLEVGEPDYLNDHWPLLAALRRELRTHHGVRLAVLYGSVARGDEDESSDLDLVVSLSDGERRLPAIATRLSRVTGRDVDVARLDRVEAFSPLLLERILDEGRVLVDRDNEWDSLIGRRRAIRERARRSHARQLASAQNAIANLLR